MPFYKSIAGFYDELFPLSDSLKSFIGSFQIRKEDRVLEIGCGTGETSLYLGGFTEAVSAIDLDEEMVSISRRKALLKQMDFIDFRVMNMLKAGRFYDSGSFNFVFCFGNTIVHLSSLQDIEALFRMVLDLMASGSIFAFQILNYDKILLNHTAELPLIDNERVCFERKVQYTAGRKLVQFETVLRDKKNRKKIRNSIPLYPLQSREIADIVKAIESCLFDLYGSFQFDPFSIDSDLLVGVIRKC